MKTHTADTLHIIRQEFGEHATLVQRSMEQLEEQISRAADLCLETLRTHNKIFFFGNGGSAADAEHLAAEFTGKYQLQRKGLPAISLTSDAAAITSIGNDFGFDAIFARQLEALAVRGDLCFGITTSGKSPNVTRALEKARIMGCSTIGLTGRDGGDIVEFCDLALIVPSEVTSRIQEIHILVGHIICNLVEIRL